MGKEKKKSHDNEEKDDKWNQLVSRVGIIANPLASRKLTKKIYKVIKQAQGKKHLRKGVKEVQKYVRKGEKGMIIIAGDTYPVEVVCHMPCVCEDSGLPYCYTPCKEDLGAACESKRPCCMIMIKQHEDYAELYNEVYEQVKSLPMPIA